MNIARKNYYCANYSIGGFTKYFCVLRLIYVHKTPKGEHAKDYYFYL